MYYYLSVNDKPLKLEDKETFLKMDEISSQWEDEITPYGKLLMGVFDWDFTTGKLGIELNIPNLRNSGSIPKNKIATSFFGFDIYGDCFLKPNENKIQSKEIMWLAMAFAGKMNSNTCWVGISNSCSCRDELSRKITAAKF